MSRLVDSYVKEGEIPKLLYLQKYKVLDKELNSWPYCKK